MTGEVVRFPEFEKGTHWRNPATCVECGGPYVFEDPCRYCGGFHPDRCCTWEHDRVRQHLELSLGDEELS